MDWETLKGFVVGILSRWILKLVGGFLLGLGYTQDSAEALVVGVLSFVVGIVISIFQQKKAVNTPPPTA